MDYALIVYIDKTKYIFFFFGKKKQTNKVHFEVTVQSGLVNILKLKYT